MNLNPLMQKLQKAAGVPVSPDVYSGDKPVFIVYAYNDEFPVYCGDDAVLIDQAEIQVSLYTPPKYDYMGLKEKVKTFLESAGVVSSVRSYFDTYNTSGNKVSQIRHTTFDVSITKERKENG